MSYRIEGDTVYFGEGFVLERNGDRSWAFIVTWGPFDPGIGTRTEIRRRPVKPGTRIYEDDEPVHVEPGA